MLLCFVKLLKFGICFKIIKFLKQFQKILKNNFKKI